ncbi:Enhancer of polycomb like [Schistosoma japonicum]|nr:Enhancer of polycomb like [Schistosoma japonicum]
MSKVSFRARQIDFNKPLPILKHGSELFLEISENALVNRGVPQIPSGMEKEEENEHHFLEVIQALQLRTDSDVKIPVPEIIDKENDYKRVYPDGFCLPKQLLHIRTIVFSEEEPIEYDMDSEDEEWFRKSDLGITPEKFESMIDRLERGCGQKVMNLEEAKYLLQDQPSLVIAVYDYWLNKRVQSRQPLLYAVRQERRDGGSNTDPYVAFRRRSEKMQTRKNRKSDEQSYEKMLILREQMDSLGCFQLRCKLCDWEGSSLLEAETMARNYHDEESLEMSKSIKDKRRPNRKRKLTKRLDNLPQPTSSDEASDNDDDQSGPFAFVRTPGCRYLKPRPLMEECSTSPSSHPCRPPYSCYTLATIPWLCHTKRLTYTGYVRRRLGRGGRVICDRLPAPTALSSYLESYDANLQSSDLTHTGFVPSSFCWRQSQTKDVALFNKLKTSIFSSHRGRPSFSWPVSETVYSPISFEPLLNESKGPANSYSSPALKMDCPTTSAKCEDSVIVDEVALDAGRELTGISNDGLLIQEKHSPLHPLKDQSSRKSANASSVVMIPITNPNMCQASQAMLVPKPNNSLVSTHRLWRKLTRPFEVALQPSEFPRPPRADVTFSNSNGNGLPSTDNRMLLTDPSVLPPPKVRCLTRDCGSRDSKVPGSQLRVTNGVSPTQIFQLPT